MRDYLREALEAEAEEEELAWALTEENWPVERKRAAETEEETPEPTERAEEEENLARGTRESAEAPTAEEEWERGAAETFREVAAALKRTLEPTGTRAARSGEKGTLPLLGELRRAERGTALVKNGGRRLTVTLPERTATEQGTLSAEGFDRMVERDARRYGGEFSLR